MILVGAIDDLDNHGQIAGQLQELGGVHAAIGAEAHGPAQDRGAGQAQLPRLHDNGPVQRLSLPLIRFADENPQELARFAQFHDRKLLRGRKGGKGRDGAGDLEPHLGARRGFPAVAIKQHVASFQSRQAFVNDFPKHGQESANRLG